MRNRILLSSAALMLVMGTASAQMERRDQPQSPPAATGTQGEPSAPDAQKGRASQPRLQKEMQSRERAKDQRGQETQPSTAQERNGDRPPARAQGRNGQREEVTGQSPRGEAERPSAQRERKDQPSRAQAPAERQGADTKITQQQQTQISQRLASRDVHRIERSRVNFNIAIGTAVPASVRFVPLPATIVAIVPQYRGYHYAVVEDEIVIIEPRTRRIVYVMPYGGGSRAAVKGQRKVSLSPSNRDFVRKTVRTKPRMMETTGVVTREIVIGEPLPETVVVERFPDTVYRRVPALRSYRYIVRDDDIYVVDGDRRVIEVID